MPRGFKRDTQETIASQFLDARSFVSLPKLLHGEMQHQILYGKDKGLWRERIFIQAHGLCQRCGRVALYNGVDGIRGEADHINNKPSERCDCVANGQWLCGRYVRDCHTSKHKHPQFTKGKKNE